MNQVEQSAKHQLKSSKHPEKWSGTSEKSATLDAKPRKSSSGSTSTTSKDQHRKISANKMEVAEIKNSSKIPNGQTVLPDEPSKPQFYFGQSMSEVVKKSSISNGHQTAIDKVKKNEALTHPKRAEMEQNLKITELSNKGRHTSIITVSDDTDQSSPSPPNNGPILLKKANSQKASSMSSGVSSLSSSSSNSSSR